MDLAKDADLVVEASKEDMEMKRIYLVNWIRFVN